MVGPGFFKPFLDAENYMHKPYGAAENNVFNLAINLYMLKFLKVTNQLSNEVLANGLSYINLGKSKFGLKQLQEMMIIIVDLC